MTELGCILVGWGYKYKYSFLSTVRSKIAEDFVDKWIYEHRMSIEIVIEF